MTERLLQTKFHIPSRRVGGVSRPRLMDQLHAGWTEGRKLTLVSAPAGYGKTTLVAEWVHSLLDRHSPALHVAWLSLNEDDNDPARFLHYLISALRRADEALGQSAMSLLGMPQLPPPATIMDELINECAGMEHRLVLILDDYHVISMPLIHEALEYLLEHQPRPLHFAITTREDPPFRLSRMRARAQMTEIRAHDLRFTSEEAQKFFSESMHLDLEAGAIDVLETRTEGWAAGLQLAGLALKNQPDQQSFLADFSGSHRHIIDYLLDEVLERQPAHIRDFLTKTAALPRFNADLCQAVSGNPDADAILSNLDRSNLFLIPLDDARGWYRYHHLFTDVLRAGLPPDAERETQRIAACWFEDQGLLAEAIAHWLAAGNAAEAARLLRRLAADLLKNGELQTMLEWLNALPDDMVNQNPELAAYKALCLLMTGDIQQASEYAAWAFQTGVRAEGDERNGRLLAMQSWFATTAGKIQHANLAREALEYLEESDHFFRALALIALGSFLNWSADLPASTQVFRDTWALGRQIDHPFIALGALSNLAFNLLEMGQLREAESLCRAALSEYVDSQGRRLPILCIVYAALASICFEKGEFDEAEEFAEQGIALSQRLFSNAIMGGDSEIALARIAFERGQAKRAFDLLQTTAEAARQRGMATVVYKMVFVQTELLLLGGRVAEAGLKLRELEAPTPSDITKSGQLTAHLRSRYLIAAGQPHDALRILADLEQTDRIRGSARRLMGVRLTQALAHQREGDTSQVRQAIESSLRLAVPEGYRSLFFPHPGRPTRPLLEAAREIAPDFVAGILGTSIPAGDPGVQSPQLPEPFTEQELRVLDLIVAGKSNQEIAGELVISTGTAKWHVHNILQKLDVRNRAQAIVRARELGLE